MSVVGDYRRLDRLITGMRGLGKPFLRRVNQAYAQDLQYRTDRCFTSSSDPYGNAWPPLKRRQGQPLMDTGRLKNSVTGSYRVSAESVTITSNVVYAAIHNYGGTVHRTARYQPRQEGGGQFVSRESAGSKQKASHRRLGVTASSRVTYLPAGDHGIPKRQFLPDDARGLPASYLRDLEHTIAAVLADSFEGN